MKRDMDLVREILLKIAEANTSMNFDDFRWKSEEERDAYAYHLQMLIEEAAFVRGLDASSMASRNWLELQLTWHGQDFLESIRDPTVWEHTKEGAKKLGGASIDVFAGLAKAYVKAEIKKRLGLDL